MSRLSEARMSGPHEEIADYPPATNAHPIGSAVASRLPEWSPCSYATLDTDRPTLAVKRFNTWRKTPVM
jgi:hypothetical protein